MALTGIDHFQLAAPPGAETRARDFFGTLLGLQELPKPELMRVRGGVWFGLPNGQQIHIGIEDPFHPARKAHPAITVPEAEIDALAQRLAGAGHEIRWSEEIPGTRRFHTDDPWGNRLEFWAAG